MEWGVGGFWGEVLTRYPADLDPFDEAPRYLSLTLLDPNAKDPSAWCLRGLYGSVVGDGPLYDGLLLKK